MQPQRLSCLLIAAVTAVAAGIVSTASAQEMDRAEKLEKLRERLTETRARLNLTDDQIEQIRPILRAGMEAQIKVLEKHGIDIRDRSGERAQLGFRQLRRLGRDLDKVRERTVADLADVLTDAQIVEYKEIQKEHKTALRKRLRERGR